jgi:hypothetical protein
MYSISGGGGGYGGGGQGKRLIKCARNTTLAFFSFSVIALYQACGNKEFCFGGQRGAASEDMEEFQRQRGNAARSSFRFGGGKPLWH